MITSEKLDLMLRGGWEGKIAGRVTLVVVDEAHGLTSAGSSWSASRDYQPRVPFRALSLVDAVHAQRRIDRGIDGRPNDRVVAVPRGEVWRP